MGFSLDDLAPRDRVVTVTVDGTEWELPVRGSLLVTQLIRFMELEGRFTAAIEANDGAALGAVLTDMTAETMAILREKTPALPDLPLTQIQLQAIMSWLADDDTVADAVTAAITPPDSLVAPQTEDAVVAEGGTPLASPTDSPAASSGSESSTSGGPNGGSASHGAPAKPTSAELTTV